MARRIISTVVLASMVLHCCGRLGLIDHIYRKRHETAHAIGILSEVPIAMCSSDYEFERKLRFEERNSHNDSMPAPLLVHAQEITLFLPVGPVELNKPLTEILIMNSISSIAVYKSPYLDIFQPPRI